jgi:hypothetical protein
MVSGGWLAGANFKINVGAIRTAHPQFFTLIAIELPSKFDLTRWTTSEAARSGGGPMFSPGKFVGIFVGTQ